MQHFQGWNLEATVFTLGLSLPGLPWRLLSDTLIVNMLNIIINRCPGDLPADYGSYYMVNDLSG
jgi:hypothetical protein